MHEAYLFEDGTAHLLLEYLEGYKKIVMIKHWLGGNLKEFIETRKKNYQKITDCEKNIILK